MYNDWFNEVNHIQYVINVINYGVLYIVHIENYIHDNGIHELKRIQ